MRNVAGTPGPVEVSRLAPHPPASVATWHMVAPSHALRRGGIVRVEFGDEPLVLFRGRRDGVVHALPAHCEHQGVDLAQGSVVGDCLRCPLHHWEYRDRCVGIPGRESVPPDLQRPRFVAAERYGMIFVHPGDTPPLPLPAFISVDERSLYFHAGRAVQLDCPWYVAVGNAFDMTHLETVHHRRLLNKPAATFPNAMTLVLRYATSVTGNAWSDRAIRALSRNRVDVIITCAGGTIVLVEALAGKRRSHMMVAVTPTHDGGISILPLYAVPRRRSGLHVLHALAARILFTAFLGRDVRPLRGIRFPPQTPDTDDATFNTCYRFLCELPAHHEERR